MNKLLVANVRNEIDVLMRVSGLIRRKGFDMKIIHMEAGNDNTATLTISFSCNDRCPNQLLNQIKKYKDIYKIDLM